MRAVAVNGKVTPHRREGNFFLALPARRRSVSVLGHGGVAKW